MRQEQHGEACDGHDFGGLACADPACGYYGGLLTCANACQTIDPSTCVGRCGDGQKQGSEQCDCGDGTGPLPAGCTEPNSDLPDGLCRTNCQPGRCGDGIIDSGELCDDGNYVPYDGCDWFCAVEMNRLCSGSPSACVDMTWALWPMPDSATQLCSDGSAFVSCPGTPAGQDGNYVVALPQYDTATPGVVRDFVTGLMWQRDIAPTPCVGNRTCTWAQASAYCANLSRAGFDDWRLPTRIELVSIVDYGRYNPAIDPTAFPSTPAEYFWSSSPYAYYATGAGVVNFGYGGTAGGAMTINDRVRCVR